MATAESLFPAHLVDKFRAAYADALALITERYDSVYDLRNIALHGDCHRGNVLWTDDGPHFVTSTTRSTGRLFRTCG